jgi:hypothetical protein
MTLYPDSLCPRSFCLCTSWFSTVSSGLSFCFGVLLYAMLTHRLSFGFCSLGLHRPNISSRPPWIPHHIASQTPARLARPNALHSTLSPLQYRISSSTSDQLGPRLPVHPVLFRGEQRIHLFFRNDTRLLPIAKPLDQGVRKGHLGIASWVLLDSWIGSRKYDEFFCEVDCARWQPVHRLVSKLYSDNHLNRTQISRLGSASLYRPAAEIDKREGIHAI